MAHPANDLTGERLGPWIVERKIGSGGQGDVYRATRTDENFRQTVAIKVLAERFPSAATLRRFEEEQANLSGLSHPHIANLLGTGTTADERPYFAMDLVDGKPIDVFANERALSISQRLELFLKVCQAVSFAHRHLIVHLDLKPANILVTPEENPKLLDFGLARRMAGKDAGTAREIDAFSRPYASPEQVTPGSALSTLSDVYSLGAILYELLTGHPVVNFAQMTDEAAIHAICDQDPVRPSLVVGQPRLVHAPGGREFEFTPGKLAEMRSVSPAELRAGLRGDLDNIILVALRKEPHRRYPSVEELARDVERHLRGQRVHARAASPTYAAIRIARRTPVLIAASALLISAALGTWVLPQSIRQTEEASQSTAEVLQAETCQVASELQTQVAPILSGRDRERVERIVRNIRRESACADAP